MVKGKTLAGAELRKALVDGAAASSPEPMVQLYEGHRTGSHSLVECVQGMTRSDVDDVWAGIAVALPRHLPGTGEANASYIEAVSLFAAMIVKEEAKSAPPASLVMTLYEALLQLDFGTSEQDAIGRLCEAWYAAQMTRYEEVVPATIVYLLTLSVCEHGKLVDVKRVCAMKESLLLLEIGGEGFASIQDAIMRAATHPNYVLHKEGQSFLGFTLTLKPALTRMVHRAIKSQLPRMRNAMVSQYGEIYHSAWKKATGQSLLCIENDCLQDLAIHCVHAASPALASSLRRILGTFHAKKKYQNVDEMLHRVYEPILWRSLTVANPTVRKQSALLFIDAFPIQNPEAPQAEFEHCMQRQINALSGLMSDEEASVREVGVMCVGKALSVFWDLLPLQTAQSLLVRLVTELSFDASCAGVRVSALRSIRTVLDNHLSHPMMGGLAVHLRPHIHDSSERVRAAMCDLLLKVSGIKGLTFYDVVPLDDVLLRLAADGHRPSVASRITKLLLPSYLASTKAPPELLRRLCAMLKQNQRAAEVFYGEAASLTSPQHMVNFMVMVFHALSIAAQTGDVEEEMEGGGKKAGKKGGKGKKRKGGKREAAEEDEAEEDEEEEGVRGNSEMLQLVPGLLAVMSSVMSSLRPILDEPKWAKLRDYVGEEIDASSFLELISLIPNKGCHSSIWNICANLPVPPSAEQSKECSERLSSLPDADEASAQAGPMVECLITWRMHGDLFSSISAGITSLMTGKDKGAWESEGALVWCAQYAVASERVRERLMSTPAGLSALSGSLLLSRKESEARSVGKASNKGVSDKAVFDLATLHAKLELHSAKAKNCGGDEAMSGLAKWCEAKIVPGIGRRGADGFSEEMCRRSMFVIADALTLGLVSDEAAADCLSFVKACVDAASGLKDEVEASKMLHSAVKVAFQVGRAGLLKGGSEVSECVEAVLKAPEGHLKMSKAWLSQIEVPVQAPPITA